MAFANKMSLLYPDPKILGTEKTEYRTLDAETAHNLGLDRVVNDLSPVESDRTFIMHVLTEMTDSPDVAEYRAEIFEDIKAFPSMREEMMTILDRISFLRDYGSFKRNHEETASVYELMHRLEEINDYIICVEALQKCLSACDIKSRGLVSLKKHVDEIYHDHAFDKLKEDISGLKASTQDLKSVTIGINLNNRFEAESIGLVSINNKKFSKSGVLGNFSDAISAQKGGIQDGNEWDEDYRYRPFSATDNDLAAIAHKFERYKMVTASPYAFLTVASIARGDVTSDVTRYMDNVANHMMYLTVKKLKEVLNNYVNITITEITDLIPEFMYYIRWVEYLEKMETAGYHFHRANAVSGTHTRAKGLYSLLLAQSHLNDRIDIVANDLEFDRDRCVYILTGANRGGKTTVTVAVGLLFVLAQGGIYVPADTFEYVPVDCIYTHFPADEDKTMDLGRLGEECTRFKELYENATSRSLILLNETFSTTSFEEGYFIARDAVRAILSKGTRTIYNTHMHKLARELDEINASVGPAAGSLSGDAPLADNPSGSSGAAGYRAESLIVCSEGGNRSFRIEVAPPEGMSYAEDIARKYGVTYDCLTGAPAGNP